MTNSSVIEAALGANASVLKSISEGLHVDPLRTYLDNNALLARGAVADLASGLSERFLLPDLGLASSLALQMPDMIREAYGMPYERLQSVFESFHNPWLDSYNQLVSAEAVARIQGLGAMLAEHTAFNPDFAALLRSNLGDWRDPIALPDGIEDHTVRAELYLERGLDRSLVEMPDAAFDENLTLSGLAFAPSDNEVDGRHDEAGLSRTNEMHDVLQRFEAELRSFIERVMMALYGDKWLRSRLPNGMLDRWLDKRRKDPRGESWEILDYADFTDYVEIICRDDNFKEAFSAFFDRKESARESLQRLAPSRIATMHSRPLGRDDALFATVEIRRLFLIIRKDG